KLVRNAERPNNRKLIDLWVATPAEHLDDDPFATLLQRREAQQFDHNLVVGLGALGAGIADVDAMREDGAIDANEALPVALEIGADKLLAAAFDYFDNLADPFAAAGGFAKDADEHLVAAHGVERIMACDEVLRGISTWNDSGPHHADARWE